MTAALEVRGLRVRLGTERPLGRGGGSVTVVDDFDLDLEPGSVTGLIGPNGAGKTTVVDAVSGVVRVAAGAISVAGRRVDHLPPHRRARLGLSRTFQSLELFEDLTVAENLLVAGATGGPPP